LLRRLNLHLQRLSGQNFIQNSFYVCLQLKLFGVLDIKSRDYPIDYDAVKKGCAYSKYGIIERPDYTGKWRFFLSLRTVSGALLATWILLVLIGKAGFVHIFGLVGIAITVLEIVCIYRAKITK
jgi:hypothetical protein